MCLAVFHTVRALDAMRRLRALSADELQRRLTFGGSGSSIGFVGLAAALGLAPIVKWACSGPQAVLGSTDDNLCQRILEAARWAALCGQVNCLRIATACDPTVLAPVRKAVLVVFDRWLSGSTRAFGWFCYCCGSSLCVGVFTRQG